MIITGRAGNASIQWTATSPSPGLLKLTRGKKGHEWLTLHWVSGFWGVWKLGPACASGLQTELQGADEVEALRSPVDPAVLCSHNGNWKPRGCHLEELALIPRVYWCRSRCSLSHGIGELYLSPSLMNGGRFQEGDILLNGESHMKAPSFSLSFFILSQILEEEKRNEIGYRA